MKRPWGQIARYLVLCFCLSFGPISTAHAQTDALFEAAKTRLLAVTRAPDLMAQCPADIYRTDQSLWARLVGRTSYQNRSTCRADFENCVTACVDNADARACLHVAVLLEQADLDDVRLAARYGHAIACAGGQPSGCTNRGGGIRNVPLQGDVVSLTPWDDKVDCLFETFNIACKSSDPWGCAMLGQAYQYGEGVAQNSGRAIELYAQTCLLSTSPTASACAFANRQLDALAN
ncbi:SEL1-like repeat protein [Pseudooctadecabacter jejudonensis]|uniref:Beta-lactamase n=1 Tax=Pseudooctadecabacter jejudonensis TaxID=1391910 RepID=A0A1Y5SNJ8_9RHOB|nr:SEL1-like repeat protein [Pseudooctadecabacter jejudonensis]SLN44744.1 hypothetical protein PSJ8397_02325 [Pseudooctadecabacter jejudonensis]